MEYFRLSLKLQTFHKHTHEPSDESEATDISQHTHQPSDESEDFKKSICSKLFTSVNKISVKTVKLMSVAVMEPRGCKRSRVLCVLCHHQCYYNLPHQRKSSHHDAKHEHSGIG